MEVWTIKFTVFSDKDEDEDTANEAFIVEEPMSNEPGSSEDE